MATKDIPWLVSDMRGGQNSADPPTSLAPNQATSAINVEWYRAAVARKRRGSRLSERDGASALPTTEKFLTLVGAPFAAYSGFQVLIQGATSFDMVSWGTAAPPEDWETGPNLAALACIVLFNGKWYYAFDNGAVNRLYFSTLGSTALFKYTGLIAPTLGAITESGGAVTDLRKYRSVVTGSTFATRSEPSVESGVRTLTAEQASVAGPGTSVTDDFYDGWELQAASDDDNYATWWIVGTAGPTVAIVDNNASLLAFEPAPELGLFEVPLSHKYLGVDDNRLLMAGAYESTSAPLQQRVWFTPVLGDRDEGDDQRIPDTTTRSNWVDLDAGDDGGDIMGFGPATLGDVLVFKRTQLWRLIRTGNIEAPYIPRAIDKSYGTFGYRTVCAGQDETGGPCVYFASARGPARVGRSGPEYLGYAIEDIWTRVNQHGNVHTSQHAVYYADRGQYWLWVSVDGATVPSVLLVYSVRTAAWAVYTGPLATALCSAMLPRYISEGNKGITIANVLTAPLVPYCCPNTNGQLVECDAINPQTGVALTTDLETYSGVGSVWTAGTTYAGSLTTRPAPTQALDLRVSVPPQGAFVLADVSTGVTIIVGLIRDYGAETRLGAVTLTAAGTEARVLKQAEAVECANAHALQLFVGDVNPVANAWAVHAIQLRIRQETWP